MIYLRGPKALLRDSRWLIRIFRRMFTTGTRLERRRVLRYALPKLLGAPAAILVCLIFFTDTLRTPYGATFCMAGLFIFVYAILLDLTRRVRPINDGRLADGIVVEVSNFNGLRSIRVSSLGRIYDCHVPSVLFERPIAVGEEVIIGLHPHDKEIAGIIEATPQAIFADERRRQCAALMRRRLPRSDFQPSP